MPFEDFSNIRTVPLQVVFLVHFTLSTWVMLLGWVPNAYVYYNAFFLAVLLWAMVKRDSPDPVWLALVINVFAIVTDIIILATAFPEMKAVLDENGARIRGKLSLLRFCAVICCFNLLMRPLSCLLLGRAVQERGGDYGIIGPFGGEAGPTYDKVEEPTLPPVHQNTYQVP
ncbi:PREDICTED: type-1 angiotensin II receptor-associated protein-like [Priapulus caudatus]|uniref:Type-1 angiotensin II receptor-associated protein-like n=1 Tax=Priapulus caudatus TaxID=37621 RepID=A0ABM1F936_PRICU|nr:PREDICTED: type-1 angiotensin II receptor-associated protein-like [Priapulus caudatus]